MSKADKESLYIEDCKKGAKSRPDNGYTVVELEDYPELSSQIENVSLSLSENLISFNIWETCDFKTTDFILDLRKNTEGVNVTVKIQDEESQTLCVLKLTGTRLASHDVGLSANASNGHISTFGIDAPIEPIQHSVAVAFDHCKQERSK